MKWGKSHSSTNKRPQNPTETVGFRKKTLTTAVCTWAQEKQQTVPRLVLVGMWCSVDCTQTTLYNSTVATTIATVAASGSRMCLNQE